jgi:hypothetical protein
MTRDGTIVFTEEDVAELLRLNPLAAEQLKGIALRRRLSELERQLERQVGETADEIVDDSGDDRVVSLRRSQPAVDSIQRISEDRS